MIVGDNNANNKSLEEIDHQLHCFSCHVLALQSAESSGKTKRLNTVLIDILHLFPVHLV